MRMWNVTPSSMCRQHLLGEHLEMHMFFAHVRDGKSLDGYIKNGLVEVHNIKKRHDSLVEEMTSRGYNHLSPMPKITFPEAGSVNITRSARELRGRCLECLGLQDEIDTVANWSGGEPIRG